jgi:predicted O-methyltransferase YrrM
VTPRGTLAYEGAEVPALVRRAVDLALRLSFSDSCLPETGQLLSTLAGGVVTGTIGETGTGCGVGLAWLVSGARPGTRLVSVEIDAVRASACSELFARHPHVTVLCGDAGELFQEGPFDLLVLDGGGGAGKGGEEPVDPRRVLTPSGTLLIDDFAPMTTWPPRSPSGGPDEARRHWLEHPCLFTTELTVGARFQPVSVLVGRRRPPA